MSFCRLLEPRPESVQIQPSRTHFVDFWSQCQKVMKSSCRSVILRRLYDTWQFQGVILRRVLTPWNPEVSFHEVFLTCVRAEV